MNSAKPLICLSAPPRRPPEPSVDTYVHRAAPWRKADQLLICFYLLKRCLPASKQTLSWWIVDAINMSYESSDLPSPMGVKAHSTRLRRCPITGHLHRYGMVYAPDLCPVLWPGLTGQPMLFRPLVLDVLRRDTHWAGTGKSGSVGISFP